MFNIIKSGVCGLIYIIGNLLVVKDILIKLMSTVALDRIIFFIGCDRKASPRRIPSPFFVFIKCYSIMMPPHNVIIATKSQETDISVPS